MEVVPGLHWVERIWDTKVYVLAERERVVLIDAATPGRAGAVWQFLRTLGYPPEAVAEIWLTHGDIDHMGSAAALQAASGARIVAHAADVPLVEGRAGRELGPVAGRGLYDGLFNWLIRRTYRPVAVDRAVQEGDELGEWQVVHTPGHTAGSISFYHPARGLILVGDALNYKRDRLGAPPRLFTPDMDQAYASIQKIAGLAFEVCCFGHGHPLRQAAHQRVRAFADSLVGIER
jgi:glyoxylase-like metal-dependent hydrolase (beta-lactamase superfamily II)